jgi:hypothetical protein
LKAIIINIKIQNITCTSRFTIFEILKWKETQNFYSKMFKKKKKSIVFLKCQ